MTGLGWDPSHAWDAEVDRQDAAALGAVMGDLNKLAERCYMALLANPAQNTANMAVTDLAQAAYEAAGALMQARSQIEGGANGYTNVTSRLRKDEAQTWDETFWARWGEEIIP